MSDDLAHTLRIRCPTWDHLENFYERKIKEGDVLLARVPFSPKVGSELIIALELPNGLVVDIQAEVDGVRQAPDGRKSAIRMLLKGMDRGLREKLQRAVAQGRQGGKRNRPLSEAPPALPRTQTGLPVPIPADVPIDELVPVATLPDIDAVPEADRERYRALHDDLRALRESAAHEVLGVAWDAEVAAIRLAYFKLVKTYHPDVHARHDSPDLSLLAAEIFIYVNKAYDRLRDSAVSAGKAIIAGPALLPHQGWIADFDDIGTVKPRRPLRSDDLTGPSPVSTGGAPAFVRPASDMAAPDESADVAVQFAGAGAEKLGADVPLEAAEGPGEVGADLFSDARSTAQGMTPLVDDGRTESEGDSAARAEALVREGEEFLHGKDYEAARNRFAEALELEPRSRGARALYHVAYAHTLLERDKGAEAMTQFEVALKHDPDCQYAQTSKAAVRAPRGDRPGLFKRLFRK